MSTPWNRLDPTDPQKHERDRLAVLAELKKMDAFFETQGISCLTAAQCYCEFSAIQVGMHRLSENKKESVKGLFLKLFSETLDKVENTVKKIEQRKKSEN